MKILFIIIAILLLPIVVKSIWVVCQTYGNGDFAKEKKELIRRANYLIAKVATSPQQVLSALPAWMGAQFQGEWAIYTCSMTCKALANIATLYPEFREKAIKHISTIIDIALSDTIRAYDTKRWDEDAFEGLNGNKSHISYYSHVAWMIGEFKRIGGDNRYNEIYHSLCEAMNRRIANSPILNLPTYPYESIYIPDMLVAIVALADYARLYNGKYQDTVDAWIGRAKAEWLDKKTGLLASYLSDDGYSLSEIRGSYSALNCYYLSLIDVPFANEQYQKLKKHFIQTSPVVGLKEYPDQTCKFGIDPDAGPIILNLSSSGTTFAIGCATSLDDKEFRNQLLRTAEIAGTTVTWGNKSHYLLANWFLVGEAIALALRTSSSSINMTSDDNSNSH